MLAALSSLPSLESLFQSQAATTTDALGNIFDAAGNHIGVKPGSIADVGTVGTPNATTSQSGSGVPVTQQSPTRATGASNYLSTLESWAASLVERSTEPAKGVSLEDIVLMVLGVLLIAAALMAMVFSFKETQSLVRSTVKTARGAADKAVVAAIT